MLMQTKEFITYFSQAAEQKSIHLATSTVKVYVIEELEIEQHVDSLSVSGIEKVPSKSNRIVR